jgi:uncharacterized protein
MPILIALAAVFFLALLYGPSLWVRHVLAKEGVDRPDLPGTGAELARHLLDKTGLQDVKVKETEAGDHYDPETRTVRLSPPHFEGRSISAVAVAAHEVSHAVQHAFEEPSFMRRQRLVRIIAPLDRIAMVILITTPIIALLLRAPVFIVLQLGLAIVFMAGRLMIHAVTLPVEFDASFKKALPVLEKGGYLAENDMPAARRVLRAAALTYVAAALSTLLNVLRWFRP